MTAFPHKARPGSSRRKRVVSQRLCSLKVGSIARFVGSLRNDASVSHVAFPLSLVSALAGVI